MYDWTLLAPVHALLPCTVHTVRSVLSPSTCISHLTGTPVVPSTVPGLEPAHPVRSAGAGFDRSPPEPNIPRSPVNPTIEGDPLIHAVQLVYFRSSRRSLPGRSPSSNTHPITPTQFASGGRTQPLRGRPVKMTRNQRTGDMEPSPTCSSCQTGPGRGSGH